MRAPGGARPRKLAAVDSLLARAGHRAGMHPRAEEFAATARERHGLAVDVHEFPEEGTPTAVDAAAAVDCDVAQIVNSLVFDVDGEAVLCLTSGDNRVDESKVAAHFGGPESTASMADPDLVRDATGWTIGGVPPICHDEPVPTIIDPDLMAFDEVWAAAGTPNAVWAVDPETLRDIADADVVDVTA